MGHILLKYFCKLNSRPQPNLSTIMKRAMRNPLPTPGFSPRHRLPSCLDFIITTFLKAIHIQILAQNNRLLVNSFHVVCEGNKDPGHRHTLLYTRSITTLCYFGTINPFPPPTAFFQRDGLAVPLCDVNGYFVLITGIRSPDRIYLQLSPLPYNKLMDDSSFFFLQQRSLKVGGRGSEGPFPPGPTPLSCHRRHLHDKRWAAKTLLCG